MTAKDQKLSMKKQTANTIFVRFTPSTLNRQTLETYFSEVGPVKKCSVIRSRDAEAKGFGFVKFTSQQDADEAARRFQQCKVQGEDGTSYSIQVDLASTGKQQSQQKQPDSELNNDDNKADISEEAIDRREKDQEYKKLVKQKQTARVIIRNLSFYATERDLQREMETHFGKVIDVSLPTVPGTKSGNRGFGFVTFENAACAKKAVSSEANIIIKKRPVAIDFSISKVQHKRMQKEKEEVKEEVTETNEKKENDEDDSSDEDNDSDNNSSSENEENDSSDEDDDKSNPDNDDSDEDDDKSQKSTPVVNNTKHELFLRNIPFDATRHDLFELFRSYGRIAGIYLLKDRVTGIGKGTAFVQYDEAIGCRRALEAATSADTAATPFVTSRNMLGNKLGENEGAMFLNGRRILVDLAVDKSTAETLKIERGVDGKPLEKQSSGKDRRNLYLQMEGRVEGKSFNEIQNENNDTQPVNSDPDAWENLTESDKLKRQRAFTEKTTKLRSPLFFINPFRLSIRNLATHVDETALKDMMVRGIKNGLENGKVDREDVIAHWKAAGDEGSTSREIMKRIADLELSAKQDSNEDKNTNLAKDEESDPVIPSFNENDGIKQYIPSVFIDRDFTAIGKKSTLDSSIKNKKNIAPSRGFGFVEFTHHVHALACLRELNNNVTYSSEFVSGGKKATDMKKRVIKSQFTGKKSQKNRDKEDLGKDSVASFTGEDGKIRIPRLVVEFTVENKAKAKKQAERRSQQLVNAEKQKLATLLARKSKKENDGNNNEEKKPKLSRGARQRANKRTRGDSDENHKSDDQVNAANEAKKAKKEKKKLAQEKLTAEKEKVKPVKPPKKKKKVDSEETAFEDMVKSYKAAFENTADSKKGSKSEKNEDASTEPQHPRAIVTEKRWYD